MVSQTNLQSGHTRSCECVRKATYRDNLRLVDGTSVTMIENRKLSTIKTNRSGYNGVYFNPRRNSWVAQITFKGKTYYLGSYAMLEDAVKARRNGEEMYDRFLDWYYEDFLKSRTRAAKA